MKKTNEQLAHLGLASATLMAIYVGWLNGGLGSIERVVILASAGMLTLLAGFILERLSRQTFCLSTTLVTFFWLLVVLLVLVVFGIPVTTLVLYAAVGFVCGCLVGFARGDILIFLFPILFLTGLVAVNQHNWSSLSISSTAMWKLSGELVFFLFMMGLLGPTPAVSIAYRTAGLAVALLSIWYAPMAGIERGMTEHVSLQSWAVAGILFLLLAGLTTPPVQKLFFRIWLTPKAESSLFSRRANLYLRDGSKEKLNAFKAIYAQASSALRASIYTQEVIRGNENTWGKIIQIDDSQLGKDALKNLSYMRVPNSSSLHSSLVNIFSQGVVNGNAAVRKASLIKLIGLDTLVALDVCKQLAVKNNLEPIQAYIATHDDIAYGDGLKALTEVAKEAPKNLVAKIADTLYKELHNPSKKRAKIALKEVKNTGLIHDRIVEGLSKEFRMADQTGSIDKLKDLVLIDQDLLWAEVDWAATMGGQRQVSDLMEMEDDKLVVNVLTRIINCLKSSANENNRAVDVCAWLGALLPTNSTDRSAAILLAMGFLAPQQTLEFLQKEARKLPVQILRQSLGNSSSPLRPILWQWVKSDVADQSQEAVEIINWIAISEGTAV